MRVISGIAKGKRLMAPKGLETRPTTDRVKESIFSMINNYIIESNVLDLFSGTGSLGIEAISRGANYGYFVDNNKNSIKVINENIKTTGFEEKSEVLWSDTLNVIKQLGENGKKINIIFMDPPYLKDLIVPCIEAIDSERLLDEEGIIVVEHDIKDNIPAEIGSLKKIKEKKYGNTRISIYTEEA
ncbi:16S rRNA (guanine(966)-N(2))-methyltransferase RsmD [Lutibacter sp. B2]|nr:16S rRNA (guanine(966)-N(2))-methyltransferase RsmD [Lutibacter sp. B2]